MLAGHSARTAALAVVVDPSSLPATVGASAQRANVSPSWPGRRPIRAAATKDQSADRRRKRTLEDAPGSDDTFGLEAQRPASISIANQASLKGKGLRRREGGGVRPVRADGPAAELPSLDAIPVDPRAAEKEVVATSLLTLAASLIDQNLNWCRKRARSFASFVIFIK